MEKEKKLFGLVELTPLILALFGSDIEPANTFWPVGPALNNTKGKHVGLGSEPKGTKHNDLTCKLNLKKKKKKE